jgi:hypothetical protein
MRKTGALILGILILAAFYQASAVTTAKITVKGYTPRMVEEGLADRVSTGLATVGKLTKVYLIANERDTATYTYAWSLTVPTGSTSALSSTTERNTTFIPDLIGEYIVYLTITGSGGSDSDTLKVSSGQWMGVETMPACGLCHSEQEMLWDSTSHAHFMEERLTNGPAYYSASCIECHTVGYDNQASNNGFDDRMQQYGWTFPNPFTPGPANWTNLTTNYPEVAALANIQCENCHGPASRHMGNPNSNRIDVSLRAEACGVCHDEPPHHNYYRQWESSLHAEPAEETSSSCQKCHNGQGFVNWVNTGNAGSGLAYMPITCAVCHDPHSPSNPNQLRILANVTLSDSLTTITTGGKGKLCMNCHKSRRHATLYVTPQLVNPNSHFGPHGSTQTDVLFAANGITFGQTYQPSVHSNLPDACVTCHMAANDADTLVGQHTWRMEHDGLDNVTACAGCHLGIDSFHDIRATSDYDGDGTVESSMEEVEGLIDQLGNLLPPAGPEILVDPTYSLVMRQAAYMLQTAIEDGSKGAHNTSYIVGTMRSAIFNLTGGVVELTSPGSPQKFALHPSFPNPFNPITTIRFDVAKPSQVRITVYNLAGQVVTHLVDKHIQPGSYQTTFSGDFLSSGMYIARMEAEGLSFTQKMMLVK